VVPGYTSVDGKDVPPLFQAELLPLVYQSPIIPKIGIMMASASQAIEQGQSSRNKETLAMKANVLSLMNTFLKQDFNIIASEALQAVTHLVIMEVGTQTNRLAVVSANRKTVLLG
jgi:histone H3/H4